MRHRAFQALPCDAFRGSRDIGQCPFADKSAAHTAGSRTDIDDVFGMSNHVLVVLDDNDGISLVF